MIFLATEEIQDVVQSPEEVAKDVNQFVQWFEDQIPTLISFGIKVVLAIVFFFTCSDTSAVSTEEFVRL